MRLPLMMSLEWPLMPNFMVELTTLLFLECRMDFLTTATKMLIMVVTRMESPGAASKLVGHAQALFTLAVISGPSLAIFVRKATMSAKGGTTVSMKDVLFQAIRSSPVELAR